MPASKQPETLSQFSAQIDAHYGRPLGFADIVKRIAHARARVKYTENRRQLITDELNARFARLAPNGVLVVPMNGGVRKALFRQTNSPTVTRTVSSATAQKANKAAWQRAQVRRRYVVATPPKCQAAPAVTDIKLPPTPRSLDSMAFVISMREHAVWDVLKELREAEAAAIGDLDKLAAEAAWDGAPLAFSDGWIVGLHRVQYDNAALLRNDPRVWEQLAEVTTYGGGTRLKIMDLNDAINRGYIDPDAIDSDEIDGD